MNDENTAARRLLNWMWGNRPGVAYVAYVAWHRDPDQWPPSRIGHCRWPDDAGALLAPGERDDQARFDPMLWRVRAGAQPRRLPGRTLWAEVDQLGPDHWPLVEQIGAAVSAAHDGTRQVWVRVDRWADEAGSVHPSVEQVRQANGRLAAKLGGVAPRLMRWPTHLEHVPPAGTPGLVATVRGGDVTGVARALP